LGTAQEFIDKRHRVVVVPHQGEVPRGKAADVVGGEIDAAVVGDLQNLVPTGLGGAMGDVLAVGRHIEDIGPRVQQEVHGFGGLRAGGEHARHRHVPEDAVDAPDAGGGEDGRHFIDHVGDVHAGVVFQQQFQGVDIGRLGRLVQGGGTA